MSYLDVAAAAHGETGERRGNAEKKRKMSYSVLYYEKCMAMV